MYPCRHSFLFQSLSAGKIRFQLNAIDTLDSYVCDTDSFIEIRFGANVALTGARFV